MRVPGACGGNLPRTAAAYGVSLNTMSVSELTSSAQDYLKSVWSLEEWSDEPISSKTIADYMGVRVSSASDAVKKLAKQGLVDHAPYGAVTLTAQGRAHAVSMVRRHRLIETFLVEVMGYRWDEVHEEAEHLEHSVSDHFVAKLADLLGHPTTDPHGDPIPAADGTVAKLAVVRLTTLEQGQQAAVRRISDSSPELLQYLADNGVGLGTRIEVRPGPPFSDTVAVAVGEASAAADAADSSPPAGDNVGEIVLTLGKAASDEVWVEVIPATATPAS